MQNHSAMGWTPRLVPQGKDPVIYLVVDDFGAEGRLIREASLDDTDLETLLTDLIAGQFNAPHQVLAINLGDHWADDVSEDIARELRSRADATNAELPADIAEFVARHIGRERQLMLRLA